MMRWIAMWGALMLASSCGSAALQTRDVSFGEDEDRVLIRDETGAVIVGKRHVGTVKGERIVDNRGQPLAFVYDDFVRLKGGAQLTIRTDKAGAIYISQAEQESAELAVMTRRIRPDGRVASTAEAAGIASEGTADPRRRRLLLAVLVLTANNMW